MSEAELKTLKQLVSILIHYRAHMSDVKEVDEEELCLICCAMPLAVTFNPCHHRSCKSVFVFNYLIYLPEEFHFHSISPERLRFSPTILADWMECGKTS